MTMTCSIDRYIVYNIIEMCSTKSLWPHAHYIFGIVTPAKGCIIKHCKLTSVCLHYEIVGWSRLL